MVKLWNVTQSILEVLQGFFLRVFEVFTTPIGELVNKSPETFIGEWLKNALNNFFGLFGQNVTLVEIMFSVGVVVMVIVAIVKFFLP